MINILSSWGLAAIFVLWAVGAIVMAYYLAKWLDE